MKQDEAISEKKINVFLTASSVREVVVKFSKSPVPEVNPFYLINRQLRGIIKFLTPKVATHTTMDLINTTGLEHLICIASSFGFWL